MDPQLMSLSVQLADAGVRNTAGAVADRITAAKARRRDQETIAELEDIVSNLLADKAELVRIAQAYEESLVAQRISEDDISYLTTNFVPLLQRFLEDAGSSQGASPDQVQKVIDGVNALLSVETVTILQALGFNFKQAVGQPLTQLVASLISSRGRQPDVTELQVLVVKRELAYIELAKDPEALARLKDLFPAAPPSANV